MDSSTALVVGSGPQEDGDTSRGRGRKKGLSEDDVGEIFARMPVKSLLRFRCLSKFWYDLILSPNFISIHSALSHHKNVTLRINSYVQTVTETIVTFQFEEHDDLVVQELIVNHRPINEVMHCVEIVGSSNGVVCLSLSRQPQTYALWNPATRQVRVIADCPLNWFGKIGNGYFSAFCFDHVTNSFKVAQIEFTGVRKEEETRAEVHVFSTATNSWTEKNNMNVPCRTRMSNFVTISCVKCVTGYVHWDIIVCFYVARTESISGLHTYILRYDIINEEFQRIEMPSSPHPYTAQYSLGSYRGSVAVSFVNLPSNVIDVWVMMMNDGSSTPWSKILTCKPSIEVTSVQAFFSKDDVDFILFSSKTNNSSYLYDPVNGTMKPCKRESTMETFRYCESLASLH